MMWEVFLLPWYLLGWFFKYLFSLVVWFTIVMWIHYSIKDKFTWKDINLFSKFKKNKTKEKPEDYII